MATSTYGKIPFHSTGHSRQIQLLLAVVAL